MQTASQTLSFKSILAKWLENVKQNMQSYSKQYTMMTYPDKIYLQSQLLQLFTLVSRITHKKLNKNTDLALQFSQINDKLTQEIQSMTKTNLNQKITLQKTLKEIQQSDPRPQIITNNLKQNRKLSSQIKKNQQDAQKRSQNDQVTQSAIMSLKKELQEAQSFISLNNEEFAIEIQMYNEKIWKLEHQIEQYRLQLCEQNAKIKQYQILIPRLRSQNIRLQAAQRAIKGTIEREKRSVVCGSEDKRQPKQWQRQPTSRLKSQIYQSYATQRHPI